MLCMLAWSYQHLAFRLNKSTDIMINTSQEAWTIFILFDYEIWLCARAISARYGLVWHGFSFNVFYDMRSFIRNGLKTGLKCLITMFCNIVAQSNDFRWTLRTFVSLLSNTFFYSDIFSKLACEVLGKFHGLKCENMVNFYIYHYFGQKKRNCYILVQMRWTLVYRLKQ